MKKIKEKHCRTYVLGKKNQKKLREKSHTFYDRSGVILERVEYYRMQREIPIMPSRKIVYMYDDSRLIEEFIYIPKSRLAQKKLYKYNKKGKLIYSKYFWVNGGVIYKSYYKYDEKGRKIEWGCHNHDLNDKSIFHYHYDKKDNLIVTENFSDLAGVIVWKNKYDKNDNIIEENQYDGDGNLEVKTIYTYNTEGQKIKTELLSQGTSNAGTVVCDYDNQGNLAIVKSYASALERTTTSEYNEHGHVISSLWTNYFCDCTGVHEVPYQLDVLTYKYYQQ